MKARDVMTAHPSVVTPDDAIRTAAEVMRDRHVGTLPVIDNLRDRQLKGIITDRDMIRCLAAGRRRLHGEGAHDVASPQLFANNITDERAYLALDRDRGLRARVGYLTNQPRTFGISARVTF